MTTTPSTQAQFAAVWSEHQARLKQTRVKRFAHPEAGELEPFCQTLHDVEQRQALLVFTAGPGSPTAEKLQPFAVLGAQQVGSSGAAGPAA